VDIFFSLIGLAAKWFVSSQSVSSLFVVVVKVSFSSKNRNTLGSSVSKWPGSNRYKNWSHLYWAALSMVNVRRFKICRRHFFLFGFNVLTHRLFSIAPKAPARIISTWSIILIVNSCIFNCFVIYIQGLRTSFVLFAGVIFATKIRFSILQGARKTMFL